MQGPERTLLRVERGRRGAVAQRGEARRRQGRRRRRPAAAQAAAAARLRSANGAKAQHSAELAAMPPFSRAPSRASAPPGAQRPAAARAGPAPPPLNLFACKLRRPGWARPGQGRACSAHPPTHPPTHLLIHPPTHPPIHPPTPPPCCRAGPHVDHAHRAGAPAASGQHLRHAALRFGLLLGSLAHA